MRKNRAGANFNQVFEQVANTFDQMGLSMAESVHGRVPEDYQRARWQRIVDRPIEGVMFIRQLGKQSGRTSIGELNKLWEEYKSDMRKRYPDVEEKHGKRNR